MAARARHLQEVQRQQEQQQQAERRQELDRELEWLTMAPQFADGKLMNAAVMKVHHQPRHHHPPQPPQTLFCHHMLDATTGYHYWIPLLATTTG